MNLYLYNDKQDLLCQITNGIFHSLLWHVLYILSVHISFHHDLD